MASTDIERNQVFRGGRTPIVKSTRTTTATSKAGYVVVGVGAASPDIVEASGTIVGGVGSGVLGVQKERTDIVDIDTVLPDNTTGETILKGSGSVVRVPVEANMGAIATGEKLVVSEATDGHVQKAEYTTPSTPNAGENKVAADQNRYNDINHVGFAHEDSANDASVRWIDVLI